MKRTWQPYSKAPKAQGHDKFTYRFFLGSKEDVIVGKLIEQFGKAEKKKKNLSKRTIIFFVRENRNTNNKNNNKNKNKPIEIWFNGKEANLS